MIKHHGVLMIGRLAGQVISKTPPLLLLDVNGVGYEVEAPMTTFYDLPETGQAAVLLIHTVVREDAFLLYGFGSEDERSMFRHLIRINGVGPKLALTILSGITTLELTRCVVEHDVASLVKLPGIGKKTAERLIIELKDRLADRAARIELGDDGSDYNVSNSPRVDAITALIALGYKSQEAEKMVKMVDASFTKSEEIIRHALQSVVTKA